MVSRDASAVSNGIVMVKILSTRMSNFEILGLPIDELGVFLAGAHPDPFRILGPHRVGENLVIRVFRPDAKEIRIIIGDGREPDVEANRLHADGFFQAVLPGRTRDLDYRCASPDGTEAS